MRTTRVILASLALLLLCLVLGGQARRYPADEDDAVDRLPHHKHRHRHELQPSRYPAKKRPGNDEDDYYDDTDYEDYLDEEEPLEEDYKDRRAGRSHTAPKRSNHRRYPPSRYHHRGGGYHVGSARGHDARAHDRAAAAADRHRSRSNLANYRKRWKDEEEEPEEDVDYDRARRRYGEEEEDADDEFEYYGKHKSPRRTDKARRSRYEPRKDWRYKLDDEEDEEDYAYDADDEASEELENERANRSRKHSARSHFRPAHQEEPPKSLNRRSAHNKLEEWMKRVRASSARKSPEELEEAEDEQEEEELWKDAEELDNDFYKNDESTSLKSYDDIIRRLTEDRGASSTAATAAKRDYRNTFYDSRRNRSGARHANLVDGLGRKKSLQDELEEEEVAQADANMDDPVASASTPSTTRAPTTTSTTTTTTTLRPWWNSGPSKNTRNFNSESQSKSDSPMSPISVAKWDNLGTREGVEKTRNSMLGESNRASEFNAVQRHAKRVAMEGSCRWPRAKVIPVLDIYYNSTATYYPHCVILHRCSDDTGCCSSETLTCEAKHSQRVELDFHVTYLHGNQGIVKLSFDNHTECLCNLRNNFDGHRNPRHNVHQQAPANIVKQQQPRKPCRCPSNFLPTITSDDTCECTCPEKEETCQKLLIGKGYLSWVDRVCIQGGNCTSPKCVYGAYIVENGSCPQKRKAVEENFYSKSKYTRRPQLPRHNHPYLRGRSWNSP